MEANENKNSSERSPNSIGWNLVMLAMLACAELMAWPLLVRDVALKGHHLSTPFIHFMDWMVRGLVVAAFVLATRGVYMVRKESSHGRTER